MADETAVVANGDMTEQVAQVNSEELEAAKAENAGEGADPQESENDGELDEQGNKRRSGYQRTKEARERAERERDEERRQKEYWIKVALDAQGKKTADPEPVERQPSEPKTYSGTPEPTWRDFDNGDGTYDQLALTKALAKWTYGEEKAKDRAESEKKTFQESLQTEWNDALKKYPDLVEVMQVPVIPTGKKGEFVQAEIDNSPFVYDLSYYLGTHPDEAREIVGKSEREIKQAFRIIEAQFALPKSAEPPKPKAVVAPPVTQAPKPTTAVPKPSGVSHVDIYDDKLPYKDYVKAREAQLKRK